MKAIIAYVPVLHQGYLRFFEKYRGFDLFLLGRDIIDDFRPLVKDIRALDPRMMRDVIDFLGIFQRVEILDQRSISQISFRYPYVVMPDEDEMRVVAQRYFPNEEVEFEDVFLRWDSTKSLSKKIVQPDRVISSSSEDQQFIELAYGLAGRSSDWWRQIGALIVRDGGVLLTAWNRHVPSDYVLHLLGDPRANFSKGVNLELSTALHAEAALIAEAARLGIPLEGASLYCTTFPCPPCARSVSYSGIKRLFYVEGYAILDGEDLLKHQGVEIIKVETPPA